MRFSPTIALGCLAWTLVGCGGGGPSVQTLSSRPAGSAAGDLESPAVVSPALEEAREDYFAGVRAFVAGELDEAETLFLQANEALRFAGSAQIADLEARDADLLRGKLTYFLEKIDAQRGFEDTGSINTEEVAAGPTESDWKVTHGAITPKTNRHVERWLKYFTGDGRHVYQKWLDRKSAVDPIFREAFAKHGIPAEIAYHAMIESGYSTSAYSWAHAVGIWQFVRATGRRYGLRVDWWVDERRDPYKSSDAASHYLADLYEEFQDWELALAAYNVGEGRVRKQIRRQNTRDFWQLKLPRETRNHIPKFYAALILGTDPEKYGFTVNHSERRTSELVKVDYTVDFEVLGECAGAKPQVIAELNPALVRKCTPPDEGGYLVRVPIGTSGRVQTALADLPADKRVRWARHKVRRGDTISEIAERYGTSINAIVSSNRLRSRNFLSVGQELMIPRGQKHASPPAFASTGAPSRKVTYTVRKGDTLSEIAEKYGTSSKSLRRWNRLGRHIYPGQKLTVYTNGGSGSTRSASVKVRKGDTLWDIARAHGVSLTSLLRENNLSKRSTIRPGDTLRIPRS